MDMQADWGEKLNKGRKIAEKVIFPLLLLLYPLLLINQGIDISDTTYSLGYYRFMDDMDITWVLATYLSNVAGALLMKLPMGGTLLGMNLYTGLIASAIALVCYYAVGRWIPAWIVFAGEVTALSLCWCPTTTLYNYLTYLLFAAGGLLLLKALFDGKNLYYVLAGICLGLNVMVRFSNLVEAALIVAVWYAGWLDRDKPGDIAKRTGLCLAGYLAGFGSVLLVIMAKYGFSAFGGMIGSLFNISEEASDYTLTGMVLDTASAYLAGLRWMAYMVPCIGAGIVMFLFKKGSFEKIKKVLYCMGIVILLRFYWGQGMFSLRYYNEGCIFQWMMLFLILSVICCIVGITSPVFGRREKIFSMAVLVIILITPLGSNNYTYQNMNNMFLAAPYTLWMCYRIWLKTRDKSIYFPWQAFAAVIILMTVIQGIGFGSNYVFRDGIYGEARDSQVKNSAVLKGMYTTADNAQSLTSLIDFCEKNGINKKPVLIWGDAPGLSYILDVPSAIFTTWPEIPSNTYDALNKALLELTVEPAVILHNEEGQPLISGKKSDLILDYIDMHNYTCIFENSNYKIYQASEEEGAGLQK